jgi:hypothetical protein
VQSAFKSGGWKGREEIARLLPGPTIEENQQLPAGVQPINRGGADFVRLGLTASQDTKIL